jgi:hypothetical protein
MIVEVKKERKIRNKIDDPSFDFGQNNANWNKMLIIIKEDRIN